MQSNGFYCRAGGKSIRRVWKDNEIQPTELHERVPFFCAYNMVEKAEEFMYKAKLSKY
jgi:fructose-1,6-bisphosphatase I